MNDNPFIKVNLSNEIASRSSIYPITWTLTYILVCRNTPPESRRLLILLFIRSEEGLTLETSASLSLQGGNLTPINLFDIKF